MSRTSKLHEVLAVEGTRKNAFAKILDESRAVFANKPNLFMGQLKTLRMFDDEEAVEEVVEVVEVTTTVPMRLNYTAKFVKEYVDVVLAKELTNQRAVGSLELGGNTYEGLPATFLLGLEAKLARLRAVFAEIPTHAPGVAWKQDVDHKFGGVKVTAEPVRTKKTRKVITPFVLYDATDKHPAQVEKLSEDKPVGEFAITTWSGMLSSAEKHQLLDRVDKLIEQVKKARMQANETEVVPTGDFSTMLMHYILGPDIVSCGTSKEESE